MLALPSGTVRRESFIRPFRRPRVKRAWPDDPVIVVLLDHVCAPAGHARGGKDRRVKRGIEAEHRENGRGVEINVGAEMFLALHRRLELFADRHPLLLPYALTEIAPDLAHDRHPR